MATGVQVSRAVARYELTRSDGDRYAGTYLRAAMTLSRDGDVLAYANERRDASRRAFASRAPTEAHAAKIERALHEAWQRSRFVLVSSREVPPATEVAPFDPGVVHDATELPNEIDEALDPRVTTLRQGFLTAASISPLHADESWDLPGCLVETLTHPRSRLLEELTLPYDGTFDEVIDVLAILGPMTMRKLVVGRRFGHGAITDDACAEVGHVGDATPLFVALPRLEEVALRVGRLHLATFEAPSLRALTIETDPLLPETLHAISRAKLPKLERLALWLGLPCALPEPHISADDLASLFSAGLPALRSLRLSHTVLSDALCARLAAAPLAAQLEVLDLSKGNLTTTGARLLAGSRSAFPRLRKLDVSANGLHDEDRARLEQTYEEVVCHRQYHPSWYRPDQPGA